MRVRERKVNTGSLLGCNDGRILSAEEDIGGFSRELQGFPRIRSSPGRLQARARH